MLLDVCIQHKQKKGVPPTFQQFRLFLSAKKPTLASKIRAEQYGGYENVS